MSKLVGFLHDVFNDDQTWKSFRERPEATARAAGLSEEEIDVVTKRDLRGLRAFLGDRSAFTVIIRDRSLIAAIRKLAKHIEKIDMPKKKKRKPKTKPNS